MTNTVYDVDFTRALPDPLKNDDKMLALGRVIAGELQENIRLARLTIIYARIDELEENILDILAHDLHVDWYDDSYPIAAKRQVIKDSVKVHKRLGTKYSMVTALRSVFPNTEVEEWFEYGGKPFCFRIILDMSYAKSSIDIHQIIWNIEYHKRLTTHLDRIIIRKRHDSTLKTVAVSGVSRKLRLYPRLEREILAPGESKTGIYTKVCNNITIYPELSKNIHTSNGGKNVGARCKTIAGIKIYPDLTHELSRAAITHTGGCVKFCKRLRIRNYTLDTLANAGLAPISGGHIRTKANIKIYSG